VTVRDDADSSGFLEGSRFQRSIPELQGAPGPVAAEEELAGPTAAYHAVRDEVKAAIFELSDEPETRRPLMRSNNRTVGHGDQFVQSDSEHEDDEAWLNPIVPQGREASFKPYNWVTQRMEDIRGRFQRTGSPNDLSKV
jgi:hypothetical protein